MNAFNVVFLANLAVWTGIAGYVLSLIRRQKRLEQRLHQLEMSCDSDPRPE